MVPSFFQIASTLGLFLLNSCVNFRVSLPLLFIPSVLQNYILEKCANSRCVGGVSCMFLELFADFVWVIFLIVI